jgi:hypothetical protein
MSFDFAGTYKARVLAIDNDIQLVQLNQRELNFEVKGLGDMALPVRSMSESSISWAESLRDRDEALPLFDKNLAQTVPPSASLLFAPFVLFVLLRPSSPASLSQPTTNAINSLDNHVVGPLVMRATHNRCRPTRERPTGWACSRACSSASRAGGSASGRR